MDFFFVCGVGVIHEKTLATCQLDSFNPYFVENNKFLVFRSRSSVKNVKKHHGNRLSTTKYFFLENIVEL